MKFAYGSTVAFPFDENDVVSWLEAAKDDCIGEDFQEFLGGYNLFCLLLVLKTVFILSMICIGTRIDHEDLSTYWTKSEQFHTW